VGTRESKASLASADEAPQGKLGVSVRPLTPEERKQANVERGVVVEQVAGAAARAGIRAGDVIVAANRVPVATPEDLKAAIDKSGKTVALLIQRDDAQIFVPVRIG
jgi:serine protease Do